MTNIPFQSDAWSQEAAFAVFAIFVWILEYLRRSNSTPDVIFFLKKLNSIASRFAVEFVMIITCAIFVGALLVSGSIGKDATPIPEEDQEVWQEIQNEWPLLSTADSLLALQAMVRVLLAFSAVRWGADAVESPLAGSPAIFFTCACFLRVTLLWLSPVDVYHLDGPLGGKLNMAFEVASLVALAAFSWRCLYSGVFKITSVVPVLLSVAASSVMAKLHHLALALPNMVSLDVLFGMTQFLEFFAALAFFWRTSRVAPVQGGFSSLLHVILPVQQFLPVYFMLIAWGSQPLEEIQALVGAGKPLEVMQVLGAAQVGLYLISGAVHVASCENSQSTSPLLRTDP